MTGYIFIAFLLLFMGLYTMGVNLMGATPNFEYVFSNVRFMLLITTPILTMRILSEERRQKTDQLLFSAPVSTLSIVLGKFFAAAAVFALPLLLCACYPLILSLYGTVSYPTVYGAMFGFLFLGVALIAIGVFLSSITENPVIAAIGCFGLLMFCYLVPSITDALSSSTTASLAAFAVISVLLGLWIYYMTKNPIIGGIVGVAGLVLLVVLYNADQYVFSGAFTQVLNTLAVFSYLDPFISGVFDLNSLVYYLSVTVLFLFFTVQAVEKRRWS